MPDYEKLYHELFNRITDVIEELKYIQFRAEEIYVNSEEEHKTDSETE